MVLQPSRALSIGAAACSLLALMVALYTGFFVKNPGLTTWSLASTILFLLFTLGCQFFLQPRQFVAGFLLGLMGFMFAWRIAGQLGVNSVAWIMLPGFICYLAQFVTVAIRSRAGSADFMSGSAWALTFVRLYIGYDLVAHATEKLFAGAASHQADVTAFEAMKTPNPELLVWVGGFCEFGIVVALGLGFISRIGSWCAILYFLIATLMGGHFLNGFIWANQGWEYSALMMALFLCFAIMGPGRFSLDAVLFGQRPFWGVSKAWT